jgi:hypothetical protein
MIDPSSGCAPRKYLEKVPSFPDPNRFNNRTGCHIRHAPWEALGTLDDNAELNVPASIDCLWAIDSLLARGRTDLAWVGSLGDCGW